MFGRRKHGQALPASDPERLNAVEGKIERVYAVLDGLGAVLHQFGRSEVAIKPKRRHRRPNEHAATEKIIMQVIKDGFKGSSYCQEVDELGGKIPKTWFAKRCPATYEKAYSNKRWRHQIHNEKWRIAKSMSS